tara:strand:- start:11 stop:646 length:636 start_codon:yes stop_codon:yes gene_type:complete
MEDNMLKVYGRKDSSNVQKVLWTLNEIGVEYEQLDFGGKYGNLNTLDYLTLNPNARIPTIEEDGFILWESNSIVRYLASKYDSGGIYPSDPQICANANQWMDWQQTTVGQYIVPLFLGLVRTPYEDRNIGVIEASRQGMIKVMQILDDHLQTNIYVSGNEFSIGDIPLGIVVYRWLKLIQDRPKMTNLETWYKLLVKRPAFKCNVLDIPFK